LIYAAWRLLGAHEVIKTLIDELHSITIQPPVEAIAEIGLDVVSSMICSPFPDDFPYKVAELTGTKEESAILPAGFVTLTEALQYLEDDMKTSMDAADASKSEVVTKLARRVEAMMTHPLQLAVGVVEGNVVAVVSGMNDLANEALGDVMAESDMFHGMEGTGVDLGLTADEIMTGM